MNGDVTIIKNDNMSGSPSGSNFPLVVGTSTAGEIGKVVIVGLETNLEEKFGFGNLVDKLGDLFNHAGSNAGAFVVRALADVEGVIGTIQETKTGTGIVTAVGDPLINADIVVKITKAGGLNDAQYKYSINGGLSFSTEFLINVDGEVIIENTGITLNFLGIFNKDDTFRLSVKGRSATILSIIEAINEPLEVYDVPFIFITEPTDSVDWVVMNLKADELFKKHRPSFFLCSTRIPNKNESLDDWINAMVSDQQGFASDNVSVCCGYGGVMDKKGNKKERDISGIVAGLITNSDVNQSIAEVAKFPISALFLPDGFNSAYSTVLEDARYITVKTYAGLNSRYVVEGRTMAEPTSDYKVLETLRTVYQAIRLARAKALNYIKSRVFPVNGDIRPSLETIKAEITQYIKNNMVYVIPALLTNVVLDLPEGQDINNQGLVFDMHLEGVPIIRKIKIFMDITYPKS